MRHEVQGTERLVDDFDETENQRAQVAGNFASKMVEALQQLGLLNQFFPNKDAGQVTA